MEDHATEASLKEALKSLIEARDNAASQLRDIDDTITLLGRRYWKKRGFTVMPRLEKLRAAVLGE